MFGCLIETRVQECNHQVIMSSALPDWCSVTNYEYHRLRRIWVSWREGFVVTVLHKSDQIISCAIQVVATGEQFICSAVYGSNFVAERRILWEEIRNTAAAYNHLNMPWILIGDYNTILTAFEHSRMHDYLGDQTGMRQFQEVVTDVGLLDLSYSGAQFTWWNKRGADSIGKKLDRALVNGDWLQVFPQAFVTFETGGVSDHARCLIRLKQHEEQNRRPFKFFNFLTEHEDFVECIMGKWEETAPLVHSRAALHLFHKKLKSLKYSLRELDQNNFGNIRTREKEAFEELCLCQAQVLSNPTTSDCLTEAEASMRWHRLALIEEKFMMQKSRVRWLIVGDQNATFYHHVVLERSAKNSIQIL